MLGLVVFFCLTGTDQCDAALVARNFVHERQCRELSTLLIDGWIVRHPGVDVRRAICAENPQYVISAWKA